MAIIVHVVVLLSLAGPCTSVSALDDPPKFDNTYIVKGFLKVPYAEINEPFTAYYDRSNERSRIDYYGGMVVTIQRADIGKFGVAFELVPMANYTVRADVCFQINGSVNATTETQSVLPDLTGFHKVGKARVDGKDCDKWQMVNVVATKKNIYTMWIEIGSNRPVRYEMFGYDSLIGSHFDKYILDYQDYTGGIEIPEKQFSTPRNMSCGDLPGSGVEHTITMNPMREFIHADDRHTEVLFNQFKKTHKKNYDTEKEHQQRMHVFRQNMRFILSKNRQNLSYRVAINHLTDRTDGEVKLMRGYRYTHGDHGGLPFDKNQYNLKDVPSEKDWRLYGAVTPVKDQALCGSCWSFGTTGTIEGAYFLKTGNLVRLSQQELMDCSWGEGNNACDGGEDFTSYRYIMKSAGLTSEEQYGPYLGADGRCHNESVTPVVQLSGYVSVTPYDEEALRVAVAMHGPISVSIDASHKSLSFYSNGVYYEPVCGSDPDSLDHSVLVVGYGIMNEKRYWLIKNSWSTYWGNNGYVLISQKDNNCGVATTPTFVIIK